MTAASPSPPTASSSPPYYVGSLIVIFEPCRRLRPSIMSENHASALRWTLPHSEQPAQAFDTAIRGSAAVHEQCKRWLWFAGLSESDRARCSPGKHDGYYAQYAAALLSAKQHASVLEPVLMLGRFGHGRHAKSGSRPELSPFGRWANETGATVVTVNRLVFQEELRVSALYQGLNDGNHYGAYLRLHIPVAIREHGLLERGDVCQEWSCTRTSTCYSSSP